MRPTAAALAVLCALACSDGGGAEDRSGSAAGTTAGSNGRSGVDAGVAGSAGSAGTPGSAGQAGPSPATISAQYPGDQGIAGDPRVLFHSDFEQGLAGWTRHTEDPSQLDVLTDPALARGGSRYLRAQVTRTQLAEDQYISANAQFDFPRRVPELYFRFYARFVGESALPHHWVRVAAGDESYASDGLANTVPPGDRGFWFDLDANRRERIFNFYVYWYRMRSGRCNDGSATPGCEGDQGTTYYYGNNFTPAGQQPFARDRWLCLEIMGKANTVGESDGELALYLDDALVGEYKPGAPRGRWLRDNFYSFGQYFQDEQAFEGFDFRSSGDVLWKRVTLDAYYQRDTLDELAMDVEVPEAQVILYDDVVVATERIGCVTQ